MTKRMLIDAAHPEETRVVVMDGSRVDEFDLEAANRLPLKGNIYLARVVRVEPSLQAAFVEYGGNRHGFLAFSEIHPDYYQIPVADRERLLAAQAAEAREEEEEEERRAQASSQRRDRRRGSRRDEVETPAADSAEASDGVAATEAPDGQPEAAAGVMHTAAPLDAATAESGDHPPVEAGGAAAPQEAQNAVAEAAEGWAELNEARVEGQAADAPAAGAADETNGAEEHGFAANGEDTEDYGRVESVPAEEDAPPPETLGGPEGDGGPKGGPEAEERPRRAPPRFLRNYKIQEVIRRRQIMLVQVVKEERGTKGAALTTYISLAGRFSVLMPNSPRGGGVSRKITSATDRRRLREAIDEMEIPEGMSLIVRTAGANRPKPEIKRDCEYLLRLWDDIRERTLASSAPALIYEEADLIKRAIRDGTAQNMDEIWVEGDEAYAQAREFMRMLMPDHARKIQAYRDGAQPLFARYQAEAQLDAMHEPKVQLRSGGYLVINQTEALVAIDVNSGRATRERHIEDTALKTNLEAAEEIARQLRLRDLAGLIVVDFIDMERPRDNAMVEKRLKEALRHDRARIQVGRISHFGLLEMSRQRLRPSLAEQSFVTCPHCMGQGLVRSVESSAIAVLRAIEEEGARRRSAEITVRVTTPVALWLLNRKRDRLAEIEARWGMAVLFEPDDTLHGAETRIERSRMPPRPVEEERPAALRMDYAPMAEPEEEDSEEEGEEETTSEARAANGDARGEEGRRRRRRRRRGGRRENGEGQPQREALSGEPGEEGAEDATETEEAEGEDVAPAEAVAEGEAAPVAADDGRGRRRGRRGGRRRRGEGEEDAAPVEAERPAPVTFPIYAGPTPADPFSGGGDSLLAAMEAAEAAAEAEAAARLAARRAAAQPAEAAPVAEAMTAASEAPVPEATVTEAPAPAPEPVASEPVAPEPIAAAQVAAEPVAAPSVPEPPPAEAQGPYIAPPVQPKPVEEAAVPRRSGWWKR